MPNNEKIIILEQNLTDIGALAIERRLIRWWGRKDTNTGILLNQTDGGDGSEGRTTTDITKQRITSAKSGKNRTDVVWNKNLKYNDEFLRPYMVSNCNYDVMMGSNGTCSPFRYEINYRNFFLLTQGSAQIKLAPPHSTKYLYPIYDYENFEFKSPVDPWSPQPKYAADFDKIKCLEFTLTPGKTLFIPAYWWYSIKFNKNTSISVFNYRTYMNNIAVVPYIGMHALQIQNIKRNVVKKASIQELNNEQYAEAPPPENVNNEYVSQQHEEPESHQQTISDPVAIMNQMGTDLNDLDGPKL